MKTLSDLAAFISELLDRGVTLEADGDFLHIAGPLKQSEIQRLKENKSEIMRILAATDEGVSRASFDAASVVGPPVLVRIEATFAKSGCVRLDLEIPEQRFDEERFDEQVSRLTDASWWRLDTPKTCSDCRHAQPTQHTALVTCGAGREDYPACGAFWDSDPKPCNQWAPAANTSTNGQTAITK
ncbi:hypothetical protein ABZN20_10135 [Methylococcus sp. ANG]|uniref:hypothetical protein n=1 Tax=Methylococcus sp. ANG TaxID=3231903 RepID=UPI00345A206D